MALNIIWTVILILTILVQAFVLIPLKFKVDRAALITCTSYLIVAIIRMANHYNSIQPTFVYAISNASQSMIWAILYYFTMEMHIVHLKLKMSDLAEF